LQKEVKVHKALVQIDIAIVATRLDTTPNTKEPNPTPNFPVVPLVAALANLTSKKPAPHRSVKSNKTSATVSPKLGP
jgi:hypothetical protein